MTLREVAHAAQLYLQHQTAGCTITRGHVYELLAAAFGARSWAAFLSGSLLADAGAGDAPMNAVPHLIVRALQLGYEQPAAGHAAGALMAFITERQLSRVRWAAITRLQVPVLTARPDGVRDDDGAEPWDAEGAESEGAEAEAQRATRERLLRSPLLLHVLEDAATNLSPQRHLALASLYRCARPNPYLYEESLKGRVLSPVERAWVDDYLRMEPLFRRYERHLRAAALGGERSAALEYAGVFDSAEFFDVAERLTGDVDAERMAQLAATPQAQARWLRTAADQGSESALWHLAREGDVFALERLAERGDPRAMRSAAEMALEHQDALRAWKWQYLAILHGTDFTKSTLRAYHDGGSQHGQFYDSDFGGALFVDGEEALELPTMDLARHREARILARQIFEKTPSDHA